MDVSIIPIVFDGPNFINRILELEIDKDIVAAQLTLDGFRTRLNAILAEKHITVRVDLVEFVCSKKLFGQGQSKITQTERDSILKTMRGNGKTSSHHKYLPKANNGHRTTCQIALCRSCTAR